MGNSLYDLTTNVKYRKDTLERISNLIAGFCSNFEIGRKLFEFLSKVSNLLSRRCWKNKSRPSRPPTTVRELLAYFSVPAFDFRPRSSSPVLERSA